MATKIFCDRCHQECVETADLVAVTLTVPFTAIRIEKQELHWDLCSDCQVLLRRMLDLFLRAEVADHAES